MKNAMLIIAMFAVSTACFAQARLLTTAEKVSLTASEEFQNECKAAVVNYATYWSAHDGSGFATEAERLTWAKNRALGVHVLTKGATYGSVPDIFVNAMSTLQLDFGATPTPSDIINTLLTDTPNRFEQAAAEYFKIWGDDINMSVGGN